jgi:predicted GIY-YIG superfamily endonuclease
MWQIYLLYHKDAHRCYIGATTDVTRRLREHNTCRGAKSTKTFVEKYNSEWRLIVYLEGFATRGDAYRWEKLMKHHNRGLKARRQAFVDLSKGLFLEKGQPSTRFPIPSVRLFEVSNG